MKKIGDKVGINTIIACHNFVYENVDYGLFTLAEMVSETDSETDSKPSGYIVLCRTVHIAQTRTLIPITYFCIGRNPSPSPYPYPNLAMWLSHYVLSYTARFRLQTQWLHCTV